MKKIKETVSYQIVRLARAHRKRAQGLLQRVGLYTGQEMILFQLWQEEGLSQSSLCEELDVEHPTVTKMLHRMERQGLVERRQDSEDARVTRIYLTEQGRALEKPVREIWHTLETLTVARLTVPEQALLQRLLQETMHGLLATEGQP